MLLTIVSSSVLATLMILFVQRVKRFVGLNLPPGPPPTPIVGNALQISAGYPWETFAEWGKKYGGIVFMTIFGNPFIILNDPEVAKELLDKHSLYTSERPGYHMATLSGWGQLLPLLPYGELFRTTRKIFRNAMNPSALAKYSTQQEKTAASFALRLLQKDGSQELIPEIRRVVAVNITSIAYGFQVAPKNDPLIDLAEEALKTFAWSTLPNTWLVDAIPVLKYLPAWMPGASFKRQAAEWRQIVLASIDRPYEKAKEEMEKGLVAPSVTTETLCDEYGRRKTMTTYDDVTLKNAVSGIYLGGTGSSVSVLSTFFLAMLHYPEIQSKAQAEIKSVIGFDRLPSIADKDRLPFVYNVLLECLRWEPSTPLVVPHVSNRYLEVHGYAIPKGSIIVSNSWGILQDEARYPNPKSFDVDRYTGPNAQPNPVDFTFGHGRRICPGIDLALQSLFIFMCTVLATVKISCISDDNGDDILPPIEYNAGPMRHPIPFNCALHPLHPRSLVLLESAVASV